MAFCTNCGAKINDSARFCPNCGAAVEEDAPAAKPSPASERARDAAAAAAAASEHARDAAATATVVAKNVWDKLLPLLKRHYKAIGIAVLALVILTQLSRCVGGGGKEDNFVDQIQGSWAMQTQVYGDATAQVKRPWDIFISKTSIQLDSNLYNCPMSEAEYKKDALYFPAHWYVSEVGSEQNYDLRLVYSKKGDLLTLEVKVSGKWYGLGEYRRVN